MAVWQLRRDDRVNVTPKLRADRLLILARQRVDTLPRGTGGVHFLNHELASIVESAGRSVEAEADQQREDAIDDGRAGRRYRAFGRVGARQLPKRQSSTELDGKHRPEKYADRNDDRGDGVAELQHSDDSLPS